jgi:fucose 4-O-acetylase-like acetyltransferase
MPLFFFITGFVTNTSKNKNYYKYFVHEFRILMIPYIFFFILSCLYFVYLHFSGKVGILPLATILKAFFYADGEHLGILNVVLWFLPCMFLAQNIFYFIMKLFNKINVFLIVNIFLSVLGYIFSIKIRKIYPFSFGTAVNGVVILSIGYLARYYGKKFIDNLKLSKNCQSILMICIFIISIIAFLFNERIGMAPNYYGNYFLYYLSFLSSVIVYSNFAYKLHNVKFLQYLGKNSIIIMGMHGLILSFYRVIDIYGLISRTFNYYMDDVSLAFLSTFIILITHLPFIYIINKYLPFAIGKRRSDNKVKGVINEYV